MPRQRFREQYTSTVAHKEWASVADMHTSVDLAEGGTVLGTTGIQFALPATLLRMRGLIGCQLNAQAVNERALIVFGLIIVSDQAFAAGAASVPSPDADSDAEWIWQGSCWVSSGNEAAIVSDGLFDRIVIDSKAMWKAKPNDVIVLMGEVVESVDQAGTFDFQYYFRSLVGQ